MKYGKEKTDEICTLLRGGSNRTDACLLSDISYQTFSRWMVESEFSEAIKRAEAEFKNKNITIIQKAAVTSWQAAAWLLERKHQDEFAVKQKLDITNKDDANKPSTETLIQTIRTLRDELTGLRAGTEVAGDK